MFTHYPSPNRQGSQPLPIGTPHITKLGANKQGQNCASMSSIVRDLQYNRQKEERTAPENLPDNPASRSASNSSFSTRARSSCPVRISRSKAHHGTTRLLPDLSQDKTTPSALSWGQASSHNIMFSRSEAPGFRGLLQASEKANAPMKTIQDIDGDNEYFEAKRLKPMDWRSARGMLQQPIGAVTSPSNLTASQSTAGESHFSNTDFVSPSCSMHTDITCPEADEFDIDAGIPDGDDMGHLLNPTAHYRKLDMLEIRTAKLCGVLENPQVHKKSAVECLESLTGVKEALSMLHGAGFCGNALSILVQDPSRTDVARSVHISLDQISNCILSEEIIVQDLVGNLSLGVSHGLDPEWLAYWQFMTTILSIGLVSFSGSHVCRFDENLWNSKMDKISVGYGYSFTPRPLACLKNFIGGPIWILGADEPNADSREMKISLTVEDLQELWGPIEIVGGAPGLSPILRTETGYIIPLRRQDQSDPSLREIECHWQKHIPDYIINLQERPILLNSSSQILIGTDSLNPTGLTLNLNCSLEIKKLQSRIISQLKYYDTHKAHNTFDGIDLQATGGFNFSFGPVIKFKRNPMRKWKTTIIYECKSQKIKLKPLLNLYVGLEVSACTGNAQRVTLWDALRLSHTKARPNHGTSLCRHRVADPECIKKCWTRCHSDDDIDSSVSIPTIGPISTEKIRSLIFDSIIALEHTGIDHENNLQAYWPFCDQPRTRSIKATPSILGVGTSNNWFRIIKDTHSVATFPVISQRCLEYGDQQDHWYTRPCSSRENKLGSCTAFSTRLALTPSLRSACLDPEYDHRRYASSIIIESMSELRLGGNIIVGDAALTVETVVSGEPNLLIAAASTNSIQNGWIKLATGTKFQEDLDLDLSTGIQVSLMVY
ncbi:hypothetical protein N7478_003642 [Penicillium angulare]|uniref:uncharacterized protein n=1 Tax=Penicillium angulare TaxID=116970 RepID=UPI002542412A|nr:uncharacterized protein N7478_003642 [Penicillium angulare]KAJ5287956.1 hypothetical protein N7478_003642 [Penicillium angulare]